ncbi:aromatic ring-hydroxylating oxygenase subunit alpha [Pedomonas sp. V897]|uniref:aromatic ring-hydroxylating oxygenase subunit alpha n=1 Tax=Pedomonas sp. V897 TaxID=3446482 RepID=UPI003EE1E1A5
MTAQFGSRLDGADLRTTLRGDPITRERYWSREFMQREWDRLWTRIWHIGGMMRDLEETGDYVMHTLGRESIIMVRQEDGSVKAFYNACLHRGNRLVQAEVGGAPTLTCSYHGWRWAPDGTLLSAQDPEDFAGGNPCGKLKLVEIPCAVWGGFVWFNMDPNCVSLQDYLGPVADLLAPYGMEDMVRVMYLTAEVDCNWKIIRDNFNESYHLPTLHPELATFINDDYTDTVFELLPNGHARMLMKGMEPSARSPDADKILPPLDDMMRQWDLDPKDFEGRTKEIRRAVQLQKRKLGPARGYRHYEKLSDDQLTDYHHYTLFPNLTFTMSADGYQVLRTEPHPTDPEKCIFDHWFLMHPVEGVTEVDVPIGRVPFVQAERVRFKHGDATLGFVADQDLSVAETQQQGLHSRGYTGGVLTGQEGRIQRFHELLDDWLEGRVTL